MDSIRDRLSEVDAKIFDLLKERMDLVSEIKSIKQKQNVESFQPLREYQKRLELVEKYPKEFLGVLGEIISVARNSQEPIKVYVRPKLMREASFYLGSSCELITNEDVQASAMFEFVKSCPPELRPKYPEVNYFLKKLSNHQDIEIYPVF